ncbi:MAG: GerAB/ArcD/ProY family transporter [Clostridia bacterium]
MSKQVISTSQLTLFVASFLVSGLGLSLIKTMIANAGNDTWLTFFPPMLYGMLVALFIIWLSRNAVEPTLFELNKTLLGNVGGSVLNLLLFVYVLLTISMDLRELSEFVKAILLYRTPLYVIVISILILTVYLVRSGIEVLGRVNQIYFIATLMIYVLMPVMLLNEIDLTNLRPPFGNNAGKLFSSSYNALGLYGELLIVFAITFSFTPKREPGKINPLFRGILLGTFLATWLMVTLLVSIGSSMGSEGMYPDLFMVQMIHITDFLDRLDIVMAAISIPTIIMKVCLGYYALCECASSIGKGGTQSRAFGFVLMPLVYLFTVFSFGNVIDQLNFESHVWSLLTLIFQLPVVVLLVLAKWMKGRSSNC